MTFGAFAMTFRERQMISKIRTHLEIGFDSVCYDILPNRHCKPKRHRKPSGTVTIEHDTEEELGDGRGVFVPPGAPAGDRGRVLPGLAHRADRQLAAHADGQGRLARHVDHALS